MSGTMAGVFLVCSRQAGTVGAFLTISLTRRHSLPSDATNPMDQDSDIDEHFDQISPPRDPGEAIDDENSGHKISKLSVC
jgi:hypothetical protein